MKDIKEYSVEELAEIGRKTVESRQSRYAKQAADAKQARELLKLFKEGKIKMPNG